MSDLWQYVLLGMASGMMLKFTMELIFYVLNALLGILKNI